MLAGIVGGTLLARFLLGREIAKVISTLYLLVSVDRFYLTPFLVGSAFFFGLGSVLAAAWLPAWEGAREDPVAALSLGLGWARDKSRLHAGWWLAGGFVALLLAVAFSVLALTTGPAWLGFGAAFFVLLGFAFTAPTVTKLGAAGVIGWVQRQEGQKTDFVEGVSVSATPTKTSLLGATAALVGLASQNLTRSLHRNAVIVAALMAAIAMTVGISVMIYAFRQTVEIWINRAIVADIFMTPSANETLGNGAFFPPETLQDLRSMPEIKAVDTVREIGVNIHGERVSMVVVQGEDRDRLAFVGGNAGEKQTAFHQPKNVLVSEPFAHRYHVGQGDVLPIPTPDGIVDFTVAGVYYDYARDSGIIAVTRQNFVRYWHDEKVASVAIYLKNPQNLEAVAAVIRGRFNTHGEFLIFSNQAIRQRVFEIFGQTFRITGVLRGIAIVVAVIGIFLTLTTLVSERSREIGVLRAIGASRRQIQGMVLVESALIGLLASILGMVAGLALSLVLTFVINKAFFGWTIQLASTMGDRVDDASLDTLGSFASRMVTRAKSWEHPNCRSSSFGMTGRSKTMLIEMTPLRKILRKLIILLFFSTCFGECTGCACSGWRLGLATSSARMAIQVSDRSCHPLRLQNRMVVFHR